MSEELKQLVADAAKLLQFQYVEQRVCFNPCDPERGDLMRVAEAAEVWIDFEFARVFYSSDDPSDNSFGFTKGDYQSLALAILRAASAVLHSRGGV